MDEPRLRVPGMERPGSQPAVGWCAYHPRHLAAPAVVGGGRKLHDRVETGGDEVGELNLDDRPHPHEGHSCSCTYERRLRHRRVVDPTRSEHFSSGLCDFEGTADRLQVSAFSLAAVTPCDFEGCEIE